MNGQVTPYFTDGWQTEAMTKYLTEPLAIWLKHRQLIKWLTERPIQWIANNKLWTDCLADSVFISQDAVSEF